MFQIFILFIISSNCLSYGSGSINDTLILSNASDISITNTLLNDEFPLNIDSDLQTVSFNDTITSVLQPTDEWQTIQPNQSIPAGCDIRINLQTGKKEAKWSADRNTDKFRVKSQLNEENNIPVSMYDPFKSSEFASIIQTENYNTTIKLIELVSSTENTTDVLQNLDELELMLSDGDLALSISNTEHFTLLINLLNNANFNVSSATCLVLGSMWQNNQQIQLIAIEQKVLPTLIQLFQNFKRVNYDINSLLFSTSTLLRGLPYGLGIYYFTNYNIARLLTDIIVNNRGNYRIISKVVRFTEYLLEEFENEDDTELELKIREMIETIHSSDYCAALQEIIQLEEIRLEYRVELSQITSKICSAY
ncbi:Nucleotide exchange factor SIL1 [Oopsacas minuta]|uniref:Nucleotide exchange factor SIL1 n=1 Tax=Oopsacas minuta TaxID=111878 RepID=A0AAV7JU18_9METZ|nr:Nucleotide exchange factor SIL1 [Oopsacas minuta]